MKTQRTGKLVDMIGCLKPKGYGKRYTPPKQAMALFFIIMAIVLAVVAVCYGLGHLFAQSDKMFETFRIEHGLSKNDMAMFSTLAIVAWMLFSPRSSKVEVKCQCDHK